MSVELTAPVLHRPRNVGAEFVGGLKRPVRVSEHLAAKRDEVGPLVSDEGVGVGWLRDPANCGDGHVGPLPNRLGVRHLIARPCPRKLLIRVDPAPGDVDQVGAGLGEQGASRTESSTSHESRSGSQSVAEMRTKTG